MVDKPKCKHFSSRGLGFHGNFQNRVTNSCFIANKLKTFPHEPVTLIVWSCTLVSFLLPFHVRSSEYKWPDTPVTFGRE